MTKQTHPLDGLSFIATKKPKGSGFDYWTIEPSGDYTEDCLRGEQCAIEYLERMAECGNLHSLRSIVLDIAGKDKEAHTGLIVGFFGTIEDLLAASISPEHVRKAQGFYAWCRVQFAKEMAALKEKRSRQARNAATARWGKLKAVKLGGS